MLSTAQIDVIREWSGKGGRRQAMLHSPDDPPAGGFRWDPKEAVVAEGQLSWGIVLTHDCDLLHPDSKSHRLVALMRPFDALSKESQTRVLAGEQMAMFYLPPWQELALPETYVDLRRWTTLREDALPDGNRVAGLTDRGRDLLRAAIVRYLAEMVRPDADIPRITAFDRTAKAPPTERRR
jgi:hypothetical protein